MKKALFGVLTTAVLFPCIAFGAKPILKVYRDTPARDTVYSARYYALGITTPGATATIDGKECKVYTTGSFGAEITLRPGLNLIEMTATKDGETVEATDRVVLAEPQKRPQATPITTIALKEPFNVITTEGAYLQHGNGSDRLGGSKMNFLPEGIELQVIGTAGKLYQVALGENDYAYIQSDYAKRCDKSEPLNAVNTGSITITNTDSTDRVVLALPRRLPFYSRSEIDPSTILVTLYGATNNTNWLRQLGDTEMLEFVDLRRDGSDVLTIVMRLHDKYQWGYSINYEDNNLIIEVKHRPESLELKDLTIGLDAGHGGKSLGAVSPSGLMEKNINLDIVLRMAKILHELGAKVVLTRNDDGNPSMTQRKQAWINGDVDIAISVHNNASGNPLITLGTSSYYKHINNRSLASALHHSMLELGVSNFGLTGNFNFSLNAPTEFPNALVEVLFMSSLPEEEMLADPEFRQRTAQNIVAGLQNYLNEVKQSL